MPEDDYLTGRIENYDEGLNQVVATKNVDGRAVRGVLYFVRLHTDIKDIALRIKEKKGETVEKMLGTAKEQTLSPIEPAPDEKRVRKKLFKCCSLFIETEQIIF